ncbi:unnamed protein product [Symbiodinium sp. KB8]|nr:unnamed protein product [Symbiodinium sp. KB8]
MGEVLSPTCHHQAILADDGPCGFASQVWSEKCFGADGRAALFYKKRGYRGSPSLRDMLVGDNDEPEDILVDPDIEEHEGADGVAAEEVVVKPKERESSSNSLRKLIQELADLMPVTVNWQEKPVGHVGMLAYVKRVAPMNPGWSQGRARTSEQDLSQIVHRLSQLATRHEHVLNNIKQDTSLFLFVKPGAEGLIPILFATSENGIRPRRKLRRRPETWADRDAGAEATLTEKVVADITELKKLVDAEAIYRVYRFHSIHGLKKDLQTLWVQLAIEVSVSRKGIRRSAFGRFCRLDQFGCPAHAGMPIVALCRDPGLSAEVTTCYPAKHRGSACAPCALKS